ncbi:hypothetical protein OG216_00195 [Streptomycetaceae bacterium NBC_01309]
MIIERLHDMGLRSEHAYTAALGSIGLSFASWLVSNKAETTERADRWGIFVGEWAPTFFGLGLALAHYERFTTTLDDPATPDLAPAG